ncbi:hypothetical protein LAZ40_11030 [Cereibacter sphaeroides]|uniref:hypothetical protein n=1 Tax=Cereibacter sphaeroides TaxID=1063 RepID=UPI001F2EE5D1|nr:hypothetical protein [Cereibacter sphaeroides]MCE6959589.1 hypothetical protein [Cereibacter sphaeroides]MCE6974551.1 hypothetical protein [Cereibacter sphaeroides]
MSHDAFPSLDLDVPPGLVPHLLARSPLPRTEIRQGLGISEQAMHELLTGRGRLSPVKAGRLAALCGVGCDALTALVDEVATLQFDVPLKEGTVVAHPVRGDVRIRRIDHSTADIAVQPNDRPFNGVPLLALRGDALKPLLDRCFSGDAPAVPSPPDAAGDLPAPPPTPGAKPEVASDAALTTVLEKLTNKAKEMPSPDRVDPAPILPAELPEAVSRVEPSSVAEASDPPASPEALPATVLDAADTDRWASLEETVAIIDGSGLGRREVAKLIGVTFSMVTFYAKGERRMPRDRYNKLKVILALRRKASAAGSEPAAPPAARAQDSGPARKPLSAVASAPVSAVASRPAGEPGPGQDGTGPEATPPAAPPADPSGPDAPYLDRAEAVRLITGCGLTRREVAARLGVSAGMVGFYLAGRYRMPRQRAEDFARGMMLASRPAEAVPVEPVEPEKLQSGLPPADLPAEAGNEALPAEVEAEERDGIAADTLPGDPQTAGPGEPFPLPDDGHLDAGVASALEECRAELPRGEPQVSAPPDPGPAPDVARDDSAATPVELAEVSTALDRLTTILNGFVSDVSRRLDAIEDELRAARDDRADLAGKVDRLREDLERLAEPPAPVPHVCAATRLARLMLGE